MEYIQGIIGFFIGSLWTAILLFRNGRGKPSIPLLPVEFEHKLGTIEDILGALVQLLEERHHKK